MDLKDERRLLDKFSDGLVRISSPWMVLVSFIGFLVSAMNIIFGALTGWLISEIHSHSKWGSAL